MKRATSPLLPVPVDSGLKSLIEKAAAKTRLSQADVMRSALRIGVPEVARRLELKKAPQRNFVAYLDAFAGLVKPRKEMVAPSRFK